MKTGIKKISDIFTNYKEFHINYGEKEYTAEIFKQDNKVIAYKIANNSCLILLKGKRKFYLLRFFPDNLKNYKRIQDNLSENLEGKGLVITDKKEYDNFIKREVIKGLK